MDPRPRWGGHPTGGVTETEDAVGARKRTAEAQLAREKRRFSLFLLRPQKGTQPGWGATRLIIRSQNVSPEDSRIQLATHEEILDDVTWEDLRKRTASGEFSGGIFEPPKDSFPDQLRPIDQLTGAKRLRGPDKEITRKDSVVSRRLATFSACLSDENRPWLAWTDAPARPGGEPTDLSEWAVVTREGSPRVDPSRGCSTTGKAAQAEPGPLVRRMG